MTNHPNRSARYAAVKAPAPASAKPWSCGHCGKHFYAQNGVVMHHKAKHPGEQRSVATATVGTLVSVDDDGGKHDGK